MDTQLNITLDQTEKLVCDSCQGETFQQVFLLRKIGALLSPNGKESLMPIPVFECSSCGTVLPETLPNTEQGLEE